MTITRAHKQIKLNARSGITARALSVITSRVESKSALFSAKCQTTNLFVNEIRPIKGRKATTFIGDLHVRGKVLTRDLDVTGKATMVRKHDGKTGTISRSHSTTNHSTSGSCAARTTVRPRSP